MFIQDPNAVKLHSSDYVKLNRYTPDGGTERISLRIQLTAEEVAELHDQIMAGGTHALVNIPVKSASDTEAIVELKPSKDPRFEPSTRVFYRIVDWTPKAPKVKKS